MASIKRDSSPHSEAGEMRLQDSGTEQGTIDNRSMPASTSRSPEGKKRRRYVRKGPGRAYVKPASSPAERQRAIAAFDIEYPDICPEGKDLYILKVIDGVGWEVINERPEYLHLAQSSLRGRLARALKKSKSSPPFGSSPDSHDGQATAHGDLSPTRTFGRREMRANSSAALQTSDDDEATISDGVSSTLEVDEVEMRRTSTSAILMALNHRAAETLDVPRQQTRIDLAEYALSPNPLNISNAHYATMDSTSGIRDSLYGESAPTARLIRRRMERLESEWTVRESQIVAKLPSVSPISRETLEYYRQNPQNRASGMYREWLAAISPGAEEEHENHLKQLELLMQQLDNLAEAERQRALREKSKLEAARFRSWAVVGIGL